MRRHPLFLGTLAMSVGLLATGCPDSNLGIATKGTPGPGAVSGSATPVPVSGLNLAYAGMSANSWTVGSPMAHERIGLSAGAINGRLYAIGGDGEASMELYDPLQDGWQLMPLPTFDDPADPAYAPTRSRYFGAAVVAGGRIFYVGGTSHRLRPNLDTYDPETYAWLDLWSPAYTDSRLARMAHAGVTLDGVLYLLGGLMESSGGEVAPTGDVYAISTETTELYDKPSLPSPRAGLGAAVIDHRLFVVGGYGALPTSGSATATSSMLCYSAGEWTDTTPGGAPLAALNTPRHSFGSAVLNGKWYVAGGVDSSGQVLDSIEEYDPALNTWKLKAPMLTPRVHLALSALGERLYAMGGYDAQNRQLRSMDVFRP